MNAICPSEPHSRPPPGAERVADLRERLARDGDRGVAYRHGAYAGVRASRCPGFTLLEEVAPGAICDGRTAEAPMAAQTI
jgi:hypothetical protein